jgi:hypothetical protein
MILARINFDFLRKVETNLSQEWIVSKETRRLEADGAK